MIFRKLIHCKDVFFKHVIPVAYGKNAGKQERIASKGEAILKLKGSDKLPDYSPKSQLRKVE